MKFITGMAAVLVLLLSPAAMADLNLSPGAVIHFGDGTTQSTAAAANAPADHGGTNSTVSGTGAFVGGGESNVASGDYSAVVAGYGGTAANSYASVGGGRNNEASGASAVVGGGFGNTASGTGATVGGGYYVDALAAYATIAGGGPTDVRNPEGSSNVVTDDYGTVGGGGNNQAGDGAGTQSDATRATVGGGSHNTASGAAATVGGGYYNDAQAKYATIAGGGPSNDEDPDGTCNVVTDDYGAIGGGVNNQAGNGGETRDDATGATVSGGISNLASGPKATVGGGYSNTCSGVYAVVSGGVVNLASGESATVGGGNGNTSHGLYAVVSGGVSNTAHSGAATICGGAQNNCSAEYTAIGGGSHNTASGTGAMVPGGWDNVASGDYSFAAGLHANATHTRSFVWGSTGNDVFSAGDETFNVHAAGGIYFNGGAVHTTSDRNAKTDIAALDETEVLNKVLEMPVSTWRFKDEKGDVRHAGPMAQDFHAAFGLGGDDKHITTVDADGIALAAIKGLGKELERKDATIARLEARLSALEVVLAKLTEE